MRPSGLTQVISVIDQARRRPWRARRSGRSASRSGMPSTALYCAIGETTTRFFSSRSRSRNGANIGGARALRLLAGACSLEPRLGAAQPFRVAQPQVLVADALRAGQQRVVELHGIEVRDSARPPRTIPVELRAADLQAQHLGAALRPRSAAKAASRSGSVCR